MSSITIHQKGILDIPADAIVNAANSGLLAGRCMRRDFPAGG